MHLTVLSQESGMFVQQTVIVEAQTMRFIFCSFARSITRRKKVVLVGDLGEVWTLGNLC